MPPVSPPRVTGMDSRNNDSTDRSWPDPIFCQELQLESAIREGVYRSLGLREASSWAEAQTARTPSPKDLIGLLLLLQTLSLAEEQCHHLVDVLPRGGPESERDGGIQTASMVAKVELSLEHISSPGAHPFQAPKPLCISILHFCFINKIEHLI